MGVLPVFPSGIAHSEHTQAECSHPQHGTHCPKGRPRTETSNALYERQVYPGQRPPQTKINPAFTDIKTSLGLHTLKCDLPVCELTMKSHQVRANLTQSPEKPTAPEWEHSSNSDNNEHCVIHSVKDALLSIQQH